MFDAREGVECIIFLFSLAGQGWDTLRSCRNADSSRVSNS
jgi:hypothetical protein